MNYEDDQRAYEDTGVRAQYSDNLARFGAETRRGPRWADLGEAEKWKTTVGVGIRLAAINAGLAVLFFLVMLIAI